MAESRLRIAGTLGLLIAGSAVLPAGAADTAPVVTVTGGRIQGRLLPDGGGAVFKGVPFARPPVGELRWREPLPVVPWSGVRDARESGPPCAQAPQGWNDTYAAAGREDCLYLDVWAPPRDSTVPRAVMVWIHGGANQAGAGGSDPLYDGRALVRRGIVLVVIQYRVGIFGFFAHPDLTRESPHHAAGNYGILDQVAALQWVHDNVASFGGDPDNVTVFGQSAGASDTLALMASPLARGLFRRAICESSGPLAVREVFPTLAQAEQAGARLAESMNTPADGALRQLRALPAGELLQAVRKLGGTFGAINADGWVFSEPPAEVFATGRELPVPLIIGSNAVEFPAAGAPADWQKMIVTTFRDLAPRAQVLYRLTGNDHPPEVDPVYGDLADQLGSDLLRCAGVIEGEWHSAAGNPTWEYQFDRAIPLRPKTGHSSELPYVFGNLYPKGSQAGDFQEADRTLSATMQTYWTNFAKTGDPNGPNLPAWPRFDRKSRAFVDFTAAAGVAVNQNQRGPFCDLFRTLLTRLTAAPSER